MHYCCVKFTVARLALWGDSVAVGECRLPRDVATHIKTRCIAWKRFIALIISWNILRVKVQSLVLFLKDVQSICSLVTVLGRKPRKPAHRASPFTLQVWSKFTFKTDVLLENEWFSNIKSDRVERISAQNKVLLCLSPTQHSRNIPDPEYLVFYVQLY